MAVPKRKTTPSRRNKRRSHDAHKAITLNVKTVENLNLAHHICPSCGYYSKKEILVLKEAQDEENIPNNNFGS